MLLYSLENHLKHSDGKFCRRAKKTFEGTQWWKYTTKSIKSNQLTSHLPLTILLFTTWWSAHKIAPIVFSSTWELGELGSGRRWTRSFTAYWPACEEYKNTISVLPRTNTAAAISLFRISSHLPDPWTRGQATPQHRKLRPESLLFQTETSSLTFPIQQI